MSPQHRRRHSFRGGRARRQPRRVLSVQDREGPVQSGTDDNVRIDALGLCCRHRVSITYHSRRVRESGRLQPETFVSQLSATERFVI